MEHVQMQTNKDRYRPYEQFLSFVLVTLILRVIPVVISFTDDIFIRYSIGILLIICFILFNRFNTKPAAKLKELCNALNISTVTLYIVYIAVYFSLFWIVQ